MHNDTNTLSLRHLPLRFELCLDAIKVFYDMELVGSTLTFRHKVTADDPTSYSPHPLEVEDLEELLLSNGLLGGVLGLNDVSITLLAKELRTAVEKAQIVQLFRETLTTGI